MSADHETHDVRSLHRSDRDSWWSLTRFGFLLTIAGGLVLAAAFVLPDWSPRGTAYSLLDEITTPAVFFFDGWAWLFTGMLLFTVALCLLVGGYNLARQSLERAGAVFGALAVVLLVGGDVVVVVIVLIQAHDASPLNQSFVLLVLIGLALALTGGILALRKLKLTAA